MELKLTPEQVQVILEWPEFADVKAEIEDQRYIGFIHGKRELYRAGCKGPLCRKDNRDYVRENYAQKRAEKGIKWYPRKRAESRFDEIYEVIQTWHEHLITEGRKRHEEAS